MKQVRLHIRWALMLAFVLASVAGSLGRTAAAQGAGEVYESPVSGAVIEVASPWALDPDITGSGDGYDIVGLSGSLDSLLISYLPAAIDVAEAQATLLTEFASGFDGYEVIDRSAYDAVSYSLDIASIDGIEFGVFSLFIGATAGDFVEFLMYMAPAATFADGFAVVQASVMIDGEAIFGGVEGAGLQDVLAEHAGVTGGSSDIADADDSDVALNAAQADSDQPSEASTVEATADAASAEAYVTTVQAELDVLQTTLDTFATLYAALNEDGDETATQGLTDIANSWVKYPDFATTISAPGGYEDIDASYQQLAGNVGTTGEKWLQVIAAQEGGPGSELDTATQQFLQSFDLVATQVADLDAELTALSSAQSAEPTAEPSVDPTGEDTEPATVTPSDEENDRDSRKLPGTDDATPEPGNESETGRGDRKLPSGDDLSEFEDLGLVDQGEYVSPQFDTEIFWDETWAFDPSIDEPILSDTEEVTDSLTLVWNGEDFVLLYVDLYESDGFTPADFEELWASDDYLAETADPDAEVLLQDSNRSTGSVLIRDYLSDGEEILLLRQAISLDRGDTIAVVTLIGLPDSFSNGYADAGDGITIDGEPALDVFTPREIDRAR